MNVKLEKFLLKIIPYRCLCILGLLGILVVVTGCMGINMPAMPKISPIVVPVQKPASDFVESKDALSTEQARLAAIAAANNATANATWTNLTSAATVNATPTPTPRFIYV